MSDPFLTFWFRGLRHALFQLDEQSIGTLMTHCGQACSDSYSKQVYLEAYRAADTLDGFLERLSGRFSDAAFRRVDRHTVEVVYTRCGCELVREGYLSDPKLCLCSLKSLEYNWEAVLGKGGAACRLEESILRGDGRCRMTVNINKKFK